MYSPKISEELIKKLYHISKEKRKPMTKVVNEAVEKYIAKFEAKKQKNSA